MMRKRRGWSCLVAKGEENDLTNSLLLESVALNFLLLAKEKGLNDAERKLCNISGRKELLLDISKTIV